MSSENPGGEQKKPPIPTPAKKISALNIEKRSDRLYEMNYLHKWFAISSILLFVFTVAMVLADYSREWKRYQREFNRMNVAQTTQDITTAVGSIDRDKYSQLLQQLQEGQAEQQQHEAEINQIQQKLDDLNAEFYAVNQNYQFEKAKSDSKKYEYEEAVATPSKESSVEPLRAELDETLMQMAAYQARRDELDIEIRNTKAQLATLLGKRDEAQAQLEGMLTDYNRLRTRMNALNPGLIVTSFRNAPIFDMLNKSEKVNQILLTNLFIDQPFKAIPRVDRCTTCHLGIDQKTYEGAAQPFKTHSKMELYLASSSPHPVDQFGCTSCHGGLDRAVDFQTAGHTPRSEEQKKEWEQKYGWHTEEFLETPMLATNNIESGCFKCHAGGGEVPSASNLNNGRDLIRIYGCFGCHRIPGYETARKVGPDLSTAAGKLTKDWIKKWLVNPKDFKSEARMPRFWYNSNNSGPQWDKRNQTEINAITEYIWSKAQTKELPAGRTNGDIARGKQIVETVGCFGCHAIGPIQEVADRSQTRRKHGYNLASEGSKVTASWINNWVKDPRQVWPETKMPSLRLTDAEAADVAAFVASQKNPEWEQKPVPQTDAASLDEITLELLRAGSTDIEAREKLKAMTLDQKNLFAGERLILRYGCFGCHNIPGMEKAQPIGTELTEAGSKLVGQLDYGFLPIDHHSRADWYREKLKDPRVFDVGRVKRPEELLKMPNFQFSDPEVQSITMVLTSLVKDRIALEMKDPNANALAEGRQLLAEKNCRGCHLIESAGGDIRAALMDQAQWPPNLATEGFKTQPLWLHDFVKDPGQLKLRPWLNARMPTFHFDERELSVIGRYFSALDKVEYPFINTDITTDAEKLKVGADLFTKLQCASCHPTGPVLPPNKDPAELAPDLTLASRRLRPEWVLRWLADPQKIFPGTRMPTFFLNGQSQFPDILAGSADAQIAAIRDHLFITVSGGRRADTGLTSTNR